MTVNRRSWLSAMQKVIKLEVDYLDAPVYRQYTIGELERLLRAVFRRVRIVPER